MKSGLLAVAMAATLLLAGSSNAAPAAKTPMDGLSTQAGHYVTAEMARRGIPGAAVAVVRDGRIVAVGTHGIADLEHDVPVTADTIFPIASLDKQLTASGIMLLVQEGKIHLDDEIAQYFTVPPAAWKGIRIAQLLSHTSGLPDIVDEEPGGRPFTSYSTEDLLSNVERQALLFAPRNGSAYSDAGLFLGQLITEKASGMPWWGFVTQRLFAPAGMTSMVEISPTPVIRNHAQGYERTQTGQIVSNRRTAVDFGPLYNDVGASILDFARWAAALETGSVLPPHLRDDMWTSQARENYVHGWRDYGLGWGLDRYRGIRIAIHSGHTGTGIAMPQPKVSTTTVPALKMRVCFFG